MNAAPLRIRCCAITNNGTQCMSNTATDATAGRCAKHHPKLLRVLPSVLGTEEFSNVILTEWRKWLARFSPSIIEVFGETGRNEETCKVIRMQVLQNMQTWVVAQEGAIRTGYADRAIGSKVDVTNFIPLYNARVEAALVSVHQAMNDNPGWRRYLERVAPVVPAREVAPANAAGAVEAAVAAQQRARVAIDRAAAAIAAERGVPAAPVQQNPDDIRAFAADRQNVHTKFSVDMTKTVVNRVLKIVVDKDYRWNRKTVSRTPADIITACALPPKVAMQMMEKYCAADNVYEMGVGIYGKVLDGVWQYMKKSEHKKDLAGILRQELTDNLGMCAQGNLSRLCNVLAGYLEGVGPQESIAERLGREMPKLMEIADDSRRMEVARGMLRDTGLPEVEWAPWLEALN